MSQAEQAPFPLPFVLKMRPEPARLVSEPFGPGDIDSLQVLVDERLNALCPDTAGLPHRLGSSMRYSLLAPGKRLRPLLTMLTAIQCGADRLAGLNAGCAAEMVHVASLIFDDLPCMDDAAVRRGQPTNHLAFGQDTAILSAVSLLAMAFRTIADDELISRETRMSLVGTLSRVIGPGGLASGQISDLYDQKGESGIADIRERNFRKTAALFCACGEAGVTIGGGTERDAALACDFAENLGLAFQILDDLKDAVLTSLQIGKDVGQDKSKHTLVSAYGRSYARTELKAHIERAREAASQIGTREEPLLAFVDRCFPESLMTEISAA